MRHRESRTVDVPRETLMPITIHDLAVYRGLKTDTDGSYSMGAIEDVGLSLLGGCGRCGACIAAYNAYPDRSGYWMCGNCIGDGGWQDVAEADRDIFGTGE